MKRILLPALIIAAVPTVASAQALSAAQLSQTELRGSARFVSMAGAFGALGGDLSTLTQNPAGIGVYRHSEIGATLDVDFQRTTFDPGEGRALRQTQTRAACDNFGYVGAITTGSELMPYFSWGVTYGRVKSFERRFQGNIPTLRTSMTDYVASLTHAAPQDLKGSSTNDPFFPGSDEVIPWISPLFSNSYLINYDGMNSAGQPLYTGVWDYGQSYGNANTWVVQQGYVDQYSINFGGNFSNTVYWGLGIGIYDLDFTSDTYYGETVNNAVVPNCDETGLDPAPGVNNYLGSAKWGLQNYEHVSGTGCDVKLGVIIKPINELRFGLAIHTPTWYSLTYTTNAWTDYNIEGTDAEGDYQYKGNEVNNPYATTGETYWDQKMRTPWRLIASAAGVIGGRFIISADYEYEAWQNMTVGDEWGTLEDVSTDIKTYYQATNAVRFGAEFRLTPSWSVRAGYSYKSSPSKTDALNGDLYVYTTGTQPMTEFVNTTQNVTCGLGYRSGSFYADVAFVHNTRTSAWQAFTDFPSAEPYGYELAANAPYAPRAKVSDNRNHLVLSMGFKF